MKKNILTPVFLFFLLIDVPAYAQNKIAAPLGRAVTQKTVSAAEAARLSRITNQAMHQQLSALFQPPRIAIADERVAFPPAEKPIAFRMQRRADSFFPASAFAIQVDGRIFGITAGHVMYNSARLEEFKAWKAKQANGENPEPFTHLPYARFDKGNGEFLTVQISNWQISNIFGTDVAVFEIPQQALPYVQILPVAQTPTRPWQVANVSGYVLDNPFWLPTEEILYASPYRLILRNNTEREITGMCGSPVMVDGKVVGVYVGFHHDFDLQNTALFAFTQSFIQQGKQLPSIHLAAPIALVMPLVDKMLGKSTAADDVVLTAAGHRVAALQPEERVTGVDLIRDNRTVNTVGAQDLTDPEHLEQFLELQENDVLRIHIESYRYDGKPNDTFWYEVNVSSGQVTRKEA